MVSWTSNLMFGISVLAGWSCQWHSMCCGNDVILIGQSASVLILGSLCPFGSQGPRLQQGVFNLQSNQGLTSEFIRTFFFSNPRVLLAFQWCCVYAVSGISCSIMSCPGIWCDAQYPYPGRKWTTWILLNSTTWWSRWCCIHWVEGQLPGFFPLLQNV